jgi:hypothetical protein
VPARPEERLALLEVECTVPPGEAPDDGYTHADEAVAFAVLARTGPEVSLELCRRRRIAEQRQLLPDLGRRGHGYSAARRNSPRPSTFMVATRPRESRANVTNARPNPVRRQAARNVS